MREIKITVEISNLLSAIRKHEAPKGYGQVYSGAKGVGKNADVSKMTLDGVLNFQTTMLAKGSASTACGGYQFLRKTLKATIAEMGLKGSEVWTPELQDRMAVYLMQKRGLGEYLDGTLSAEGFANNLAKEWASLPVVSGPKKGRSFYAGDGLNKSFHEPSAIMALVSAVKAPRKPAQPVSPSPAPVVPNPPETAPAAPRGLLSALLALIFAIFSPKKG